MSYLLLTILCSTSTAIILRIDALKEFSVVLVYPVVNLGIIVGTALLVKIVWNEEWNIYVKFALLAGILALVFLSL